MMDEIISHGNTIRPGYYQSSMGDIFDIAHAYNLSFPLGNAVKYICRAGKKDRDKDIEDLQKAMRCIQREIDIRRQDNVRRECDEQGGGSSGR
jgi:hypothetical protein